MSVTEFRAATDMSDSEWKTRCDLAALYRILHYLRMTDLVYTHMSARVPGEDNTFLINRYGDLFDEISASNLVKMDFDGNVLGDPERINMAGFNIHSGVYLARPDVNCVMHTHSRAGIAVSATERGLLPLSQHSLVVLNDLAYHDYGGPGTLEEREDFGASCAKANNIILRNHGLLTLGESISQTFKRMYYLEQSCQIQTAAQALNEPLVMIRDDVQRASFGLMEKSQTRADYGEFEWESLLRMLERRGVDYKR